MLNALSIDVEEWYHASFAKEALKGIPNQSIVGSGTQTILDLLDEYDTKATFFILGAVAEKDPELCVKIAAKGHEIATHGYHHKLVTEMTRPEFEDDLTRSIEIIHRVTGTRPLGFRAPVAAINKETHWAFQVMSDLRLKYDSSIYPSNSPLIASGISGSSKQQYKIYDDLWEIPLSVVRLGNIDIPVSGGFYLRSFPFRFYQNCIRRINKLGDPFLLYVHPWEFDTNYPRVVTNPIKRFVQYYNLEMVLPRLRILLDTFRFSTINDVYMEHHNERRETIDEQ